MAHIRPGNIVAPALLATCLVLLVACSGAHDASLLRPTPRSPIGLSAKERESIRAGMRVYLECLEGIIVALSANRMGDVARHAKRAGTDMIQGVSAADAVRLPPEFLLLALDTHMKFDAMAQEASQHGSKTAVLQQLGAVLDNCNACHATYRFPR
jgi:hypothetical protein